MFTVITKGNNVGTYHSPGVSDRDDMILINSVGEIIVNQGNPITWPTDATDGLQAIVDVKAGTLRFEYDGWPRAVTEFVVSNYVESVTSAPHIFDVINYWPQQDRQCLGTKDLPEGWMWQWAGNDWVLSNGTIGLVRDDWFKYRNKMVEAQQVNTPVHILDHIDNWPNPVHIAVLQGEIFDDWRWRQDQGGGPWILCNDKENTEFNEGDWLNYHENKKKYSGVNHCGDEGIELTYSNPITAASMLTAALGHMEDRAKTYDAPGGERSMGKTVAAFNVITGHTLTEEAGWLFMEILKQVRSQQGDYRADNYEDMVAYAALRGECAARERGNKSC